jgi:hypothetical protein
MRFGPAKLIDIPQFLVWLFGNREKNKLDLEILEYPTLRVYSAANDSAIAFLPIHSGVILESLALNPEASPEEKLEAVCGIVNQVMLDATQQGIREMFYISSDERTDASAVRQLGFEEVKCYRKKLT